jgi:hypothetical protein
MIEMDCDVCGAACTHARAPSAQSELAPLLPAWPIAESEQGRTMTR